MTDTFILDMGQSNALGYLNDGPAPYVPTARVQIWDAPDHQWEYLNPGVNSGNVNNPTDWGMEVGQANAFLAAHPDSGDMLWIYKYAQGSTALDATAARTWSPEVAGQAYDAALAGAREAQAVLQPTQYAFSHWGAFVWAQGETDATDAGMAARYGANLTDLVQHVRDDFGVYDTIIPRIDSGPGAGAYNFDVRLAEWNEAQAPGVHGFSTIGYGLAADGLHYDAAGQLALGAASWGFV